MEARRIAIAGGFRAAPDLAMPDTPTSMPDAELLQLDGTPDWEAISFDVLCSRCGYNLRTLTRPKCTECGLEFEWPEVIQRAVHQSDFLFEHHWHRRPIRSFVTTVWRSFEPRKFWAQVSIHQRIQPGPLWFLILLASPVFWGSILGSMHLLKLFYFSTLPLRSARSPLEQLLYANMRPFFNLMFPMPRRWWAVPLFLAFVWIFLLSLVAMLCALRQTLAKCRVRPIQMLRVVAYAAIPASQWCALALLANLWVFQKLPYDHFLRSDFIVQPSGPLIFILIFAHYLQRGLKYYLQLPRSGRMAMTVAFVGFLAAANYLGAFLMSPLGLGWFPRIMPF
jgi:hypothetical protein